jgi:putative flippase GtrA
MSFVELCEEKSLIQSDRLEVRKSVEASTPTEVPQTAPAKEKGRPVLRLPSYRPLPWRSLNALLDSVDRLTKGRAGWVQRFCTYILIGGFAALVNLTVFYVAFHLLPLPVSPAVHNVIASVLAAEISIMANFIPNDYFTFRHLPGHQRSWVARCLRFHITAVGGVILTFLIEFSLFSLAHTLAIVAQAIALILVLLYNFSFHHIFTYRRVKHAAKSA